MSHTTVTETTKTWESGKLKLTLTRKSTATATANGHVTKSEDTVAIINKDGMTRGQNSQGFMWSGSYEDFKLLANTLGHLFVSVDRDLFGPAKDRALGEGCGCPTQHAIDCTHQ